MKETTVTDRRTLICRVRGHLYALPLEHVSETMRPLPVQPTPDAPPFVTGLAIIRGLPVPVVDAARLLSADADPATAGATAPERFVTIAVGNRRVALAVDQVVGVRVLAVDSLRALPPLLLHTRADTVSAIATLDSELLLVLRSARLLPPDDAPVTANAREAPHP